MFSVVDIFHLRWHNKHSLKILFIKFTILNIFLRWRIHWAETSDTFSVLLLFFVLLSYFGIEKFLYFHLLEEIFFFEIFDFSGVVVLTLNFIYLIYFTKVVFACVLFFTNWILNKIHSQYALYYWCCSL